MKFKYDRLIKSFSIKGVKGNKEKKEALEDLSEYIFSICPLFEIETNVNTTTNELDLYITIKPYLWPHPFLKMIGYTMVCECKNINKKIDSRKADNLETLMSDKDSKIGIYLSRKGFTGVKNPILDGNGRIYKAFAEKRKYIICITYSEIHDKIIIQRESLLKVIQEKCNEIHKIY